MGNKSSCSISKDQEKLTEYDLAVFKIKQEKVFWGTIAICVVYAIVALILFLASYLSEKVRYILLNRFLPFTIVYIVGTIIIVSYLTYQVYYFKPIRIDKNNNFDQLSCPDYWKLERVDINDTNKSLFDNYTNTNLFSYRCVMDDKLFNKAKLATGTSVSHLKLANANLADDKVGYQVVNFDSLNVKENYLYKNLNPLISGNNNNNIYYNDIASSNAPVADLMKHSLIMNNYTKIDTKDDKRLLFEYKIDDASKLTTARELGITSRITQDTDTNSGGNNTPFEPQTNKYLEIKLNNNKNGISSINSASSKDGTNVLSSPQTYNNLPLVCDRVYPLYLATKDIELSKDNSKLDENTLRCAYSKICGVPWSDLNCGKYDK